MTIDEVSSKYKLHTRKYFIWFARKANKIYVKPIKNTRTCLWRINWTSSSLINHVTFIFPSTIHSVMGPKINEEANITKRKCNSTNNVQTRCLWVVKMGIFYVTNFAAWIVGIHAAIWRWIFLSRRAWCDGFCLLWDRFNARKPRVDWIWCCYCTERIFAYALTD